MSLSGRTALVTGASRGIGRAIALALAEDGADVAINYRREEAEAQETVDRVKKLGRKAQAFRASIESVEEVAAMAAQVEQAMGSVSILVNNAGIASRGNSVADTDPAEMMRVVGVHAFGAFYATKFFLPQIRKAARGDIIYISSIATLQNAARGAPYNMAKTALESLAFTVAKEERPNNIYVNIVAPPLVATDMGDKLMKARAGVAKATDLDAQSPFGHVCRPEEIANVVRFLVSSRNTYVSGEKITAHAAADNIGGR